VANPGEPFDRGTSEHVGGDDERAIVDAQDLRRERLVALGELSAHVAHEINGCLAALRLHLSQAELAATRRRAGGETTALATEVRAALDGAGACADRIAGLIEEVRRFGRPDRTVPEPVRLDEVARAALRLMGPVLAQAARLEPALGPTAPVLAHRGRLVQVVLNLLRNAVDAVVDCGRPHDARRIAISTRSSGAQAMLCVEDDGIGVAPELRERVFEPYFTTKSPERGTGLGLTISRDIVRAYGGELRLDAAPAGGTRVEVSLPVAPPEA
jgi:C4-dicarboxylate-specific signal transduction histidine kinase